MRIVFMGTPDYAAVTLEALIEAGHDIAGAFVQPDKPVGRKRILTAPPVKQCALKHDIPVFQPATLRDGSALETLKQLNPDIIVVAAYGKILPEDILRLPKYGCVNSHASLLPRHRGASPIQWAIVSGDKLTGVTTMLMDVGMDTGDMLDTVSVEIGDEETAEQLFERLAVTGAKLVLSTLEKIENGTAQPKKQPETGITYAPIIKKEMALIDFNKTAQEIHNAVRGYYSWPCAYFYLDGKRIKVIESRVGDNTSEKPGTVTGNGDELVIACGGGSTIRFLTLQPENKNVMSARQMLCGIKIPLGMVVS